MTGPEAQAARRQSRLVALFPTQSAAWLASARVAANGGPETEVHPVSRPPDGWALLTVWDGGADAARSILALFNREVPR